MYDRNELLVAFDLIAVFINLSTAISTTNPNGNFNTHHLLWGFHNSVSVLCLWFTTYTYTHEHIHTSPYFHLIQSIYSLISVILIRFIFFSSSSLSVSPKYLLLNINSFIKFRLRSSIPPNKSQIGTYDRCTLRKYSKTLKTIWKLRKSLSDCILWTACIFALRF